MKIFMSGCAGDVGAAEIFNAHTHKVREKFSTPFYKELERFASEVLAANKQQICQNGQEQLGQSQMGFYDLLWKLGEENQSGIRVYHERIAIRQEVIELCEIADEDPYRIATSAKVRIACDEEELPQDGEIYIGDTTSDNDRVVIMEDFVRYLDKNK